MRNANDLIIKHEDTRVNTNWPGRVSVSVAADVLGSPSHKARDTMTEFVEGKNIENM